MVGLWYCKVTTVERYKNPVELRIQHSFKMPTNFPSSDNYSICLWGRCVFQKKGQPFANMCLV